MSKTTLIDGIDRSTEYPVTVTTSAPYNCGTLCVTLGGEWTEQMISELPSINVKIYMGTQVFTSFGINLETVNEWVKVHPTEPYARSLYNIPADSDFSLTPLFDDNAISAHNETQENGIVFSITTDSRGIMTADNADLWTTPTDTFDIKIEFDNDNISSGGGSGGGGGGGGDTYTKAQIDSMMSTKVTKESGKGLSQENFTTAEKQKLASLVNITVDASMSESSTNPVQNKVITGTIDDLDDSIKLMTAQEVDDIWNAAT